MADDPKYSYAAESSAQFPVAANMGWDGYWRLAYDRANAVIQEQARNLLERGNVTFEEARQLVEVQRNGLVIEMRKPLSLFGKFYSEALKPVSSLPTFEAKLAEKGTVEAVLLSVGKSRAVTNKIAFIARRAGPVGVVIEIVAVAVVIKRAPPQDQKRVAAEELGGAAGSFGLGSLGMWGGAAAGAAWAGTWASPTLLIPVVGEVTEGTAIVAGGIVGGIFFGWMGHEGGKAAGHYLWSLAPVEWRWR